LSAAAGVAIATASATRTARERQRRGSFMIRTGSSWSGARLHGHGGQTQWAGNGD
jgi:hypothetical protein